MAGEKNILEKIFNDKNIDLVDDLQDETPDNVIELGDAFTEEEIKQICEGE